MKGRVENMTRRIEVPLPDLAPWFEDRLEFLNTLHEVLRNINFGRNDHLPYYEPIEGYTIYMMSELGPRGSGRPPSVGRWQLVIEPRDKPYQLALQGRLKDKRPVGELILRCETPEWLARFDQLVEEYGRSQNPS
ncbi:hypothetical protein [Kyrpidia tusciae]|uniref:hypothetical protein n=1 Tax=Kyrpidia tusciae TaxID=33943 RepID=UPI000F4FBFF6|nr:hypothetical protein [Kyrpidia tusciae]